jgi:hypothetical protein
MIIINIVLTLWVSTTCLSHDHDLHELKVVYDHTRFASYQNLCVGNGGGEYGYWLLEGNECSAAGGFPNNPILSGSAPNTSESSRATHTLFFRLIRRKTGHGAQHQTYKELHQTKGSKTK